jgi:hypothetical protein
MGDQLFFFRYSSEVPKTDIGSLVGANLAYVNPPQLDPVSDTGNISIVDRSFNFPENNTLFANTIRRFTGNLGINDTNNVLVTNKYSNTLDTTTLLPINQTVPVRPLWYKHNFIATDPIVASPNSSYQITIFDNLNNQISSDHYVLFPSTGVPIGIHTDLVNTPDTWYFVLYTSPNGQVRKLLSVENVYNPTDSFTGSGDGQYIANYIDAIGQWQIQVTGNPSIIYSMLTIGTTKISVTHPIQATSTEPWYLQIRNGYFKRRIVGPSINNTYEYYLPEYIAQGWNPQQPYMYQIAETPLFLDNNLIRLRQNPISQAGIINNDVEIYIRQSTERSDQVNEFITGAGNIFDTTPYVSNAISSVWWRVIIDDIDRNTGLVKIGGVIAPPTAGPWGAANTAITTGDDALIYNSDSLHAFYFFQQLEYTYTKMSFNPIFDRSLLTNGISIYIKPAKSDINNVIYTFPSVIDHLIFDENENIIFASDPLVPLGGKVSDFFIQTDNSGVPLVGRDQSTFLELARIFVRNTATIRDITNTNLVDTRIAGGVLMPVLAPEVIEQINIDTNGLFQLLNWQGAILPGNSVVVVKVPSYLLNDDYLVSGTPLTGDALNGRMVDIRTKCKKHLAAGVLPIVRFYDNDTGEVLPIKPPLDRRFF